MGDDANADAVSNDPSQNHHCAPHQAGCLPARESGDGEQYAANVENKAPRDGPNAKRRADLPLGLALDGRALGRLEHGGVHVDRLDRELHIYARSSISSPP